MWYLIKQMKHLRIYYGILLLLCIGITILSIMTARTVASLTSYFTKFGLEGSYPYIGIALLFYILEACTMYGYHFLCGKIEGKVYTQIQQRSFEQVTHMLLDNEKLRNKGDLYNRINGDCATLTEFLSTTLCTILMQGIQIVLGVVYIAFVDWKITLIYGIALGFTLLIQVLMGKMLQKHSAYLKEKEVELNTRLKDSLENRLTIKMYDGYEFSYRLCQQANENYAKAGIRFHLYAMPMKMVGILCGMLPIVALCLAGLIFVPKGWITLGAFLSIFYLCEKIVPYQLHYIDLFIEAIRNRVVVNRMLELWKEPRLERVEKEEKSLNDIELKGVWYQYPMANTWAVENISLHIQKGKKVAFIGKSGCGKSTALKLISQLIQPDRGNISSIDAILVDQFPHFFDGTMLENLLCFQEKDDKNEVIKYPFLYDMKEKLEEQLGENVSNFSGGQKQKMAITRALHKQKPVLLLDESISALDANTAKQVVEYLVKEYKNTTIVMVLHQIEFLPYMDEIYYFEDGKIVAHGTYEEFVEKNLLGGICNEEKR